MEKAGDMCVLCPACPQPGMNMRPGWQLRDEDYRYVSGVVLSSSALSVAGSSTLSRIPSMETIT